MRYNYANYRRSSSDSNSQDAVLSLTRRLNEDAVIYVVLEHLKQSDIGFSNEENAIRGGATYRLETGFGAFAFGAGLRKARADQESTADDIQVFDEVIVLAGTTPVDLAQEFVVPGSVVVRNTTNTQIYVEGFDYRLIQTGSVTSIQRQIDGNIADGETVLVDYRYATSGTAEFDTRDSNISASLSFLQNFDAYARYSLLDTDILSGELTNRVNDRNRVEYGLSARNRALDGWALSGHYRYVQQDEDVSPFVGDSFEIGLAKSFWGRLRLSLSAGVTRTDYELSDEDLDSRSYSLRIGGSPFRGMSIDYSLTHFEDDGGSVPRRQLRQRLNAQWVYRMMRITLFGQFSDDEVGVTEQTNNRVILQIVRDF
jgi:hypothetical protein